MGMTVVRAIGLTLFAIQTKWDYTKLGDALFIAVLLLCVNGIVQRIIRSHTFDLFLSCFGFTLFSVHLIGKCCNDLKFQKKNQNSFAF